MKYFAVVIFLFCCCGSIHSAPADSCELVEVGENLNATVENCVKQVVDDGDEETCDMVIKVAQIIFETPNFSMNAWPKTNMDLTPTQKAKSIEAMLCIVQSMIKQAPQIGVIAFDCGLQVDQAETDQCQISAQYNMCVEKEIESMCASSMTSRKRRSIMAAVRRF